MVIRAAGTLPGLRVTMRKDLSLYIHIPFCMQKCVYCDFLSFSDATFAEKIRYVDALCQEMRLYAPFSDRYLVRTIYIGGGTPSILDEALIERIMTGIRNVFKIDEFAEISIEANPGTLKYTNLLSYLSYGINRISLGLQSADPALLSVLGRIHDYDEFIDGYAMARRAGFKNINIDLMSGIPGQDIHTYVDTLTRVMDLSPEHISAYSLQVEEGTPLAANKELLARIPDEETDRRMYAMTKKVLSAGGYERYEFSNYAKPGYECRHNIVYWSGKEYIGFGIGAASFFKGERYTNIRNLMRYIEYIESAQMDLAQINDKVSIYEKVSREIRDSVTTMYIDSRMEEFMFLGLRMTKGVSRKDFRNRFGKDMYEVYGEVINYYTDQGFMESFGDTVRLTDKGIDVSNVILADFLLK